jgi:hypothetical protein
MEMTSYSGAVRTISLVSCFALLSAGGELGADQHRTPFDPGQRNRARRTTFDTVLEKRLIAKERQSAVKRLRARQDDD